MSAGLRVLVAAGAAATRSPSAPLLREMDLLRGLADRLAAVVGRSTPAGAWWAPSDDAMPPAELLADVGDVVANPSRVVLAGAPVGGVAGAMAVDLETGRLEAQEGEKVVSLPLGLAEFAPLAASVGPALVMLAAAGGPESAEVRDPLVAKRLPSGQVRFELRGVGCVVSAQVAFTFAAECMSLLARRIETDCQARMELEAALALEVAQ